MKKNNLFKSVLGFCLIGFASIAAFVSCEVGLGAAVDVESPVVEITTPPTASVIRDKFAIAGNWSDDGSIKSLQVTLRNTQTNKAKTFDGSVVLELDGSGTWSVVINPVDQEIADGSYEATVTIQDNGHHKTEITRSFIIDNTAPVVVLSRPSSSKDDPDNLIESYGQYLTLEGQAADDNDIERIVIDFYAKDDPETRLYQKTITSIPPTISLDVAKFLDNEAYSAIYGDEKADEKTYYCTITAYDSAQRFPLEGSQQEEDKIGNAEASFIPWSKWEKFQTEYQKSSNSKTKLKVPDLYSIKAERTADKSRSTTQTALIANLFDESIACGSFKLNPENSPTFSISGLDLGVATNVENERLLTVQLSKGLDGLSLDTDNMKVYLIPIDENGSAGEKIYPQTSEFQKKGDGQFLTKIIKEDNKNEAGEQVSLEYSTTYIIGVDGEDIEGNKIVPPFEGNGKQYIMRFKAKNVAPDLQITYPTETISYLKKGDELTIRGTVAVPDGHPLITVTCKDDSDNTTTVYNHKITEADKTGEAAGLITYQFELTIPAVATADEFAFKQDAGGQYVFDVVADLDEMATTKTKTVLYDVAGPTISIDSMLPTAQKYTGAEDGSTVAGEYLNGDVTMKVAIVDAYDIVQKDLEATKDRRPYFLIVDSDTGDEIEFRVDSETTPVKKHYIKNPTMQTFVIHTEDIASGTDVRNITVKVFAEDRAGNKGVDANDETKTYLERSYIVDQTTDKPVILPYNSEVLTLTFDTVEKVNTELAKTDKGQKDKIVLMTGSTIQLKIKDDDGIADCIFKISDKDTGANLKIPAGFENAVKGNPSEYNLSYTLPTEIGKYKFSVAVIDTVGKTVSKEFWLVVSGAAPQVTIDSTTPDNKIITLSNGSKTADAKVEFVNVITIDSGYESFEVSRIEKINGKDVEFPVYDKDNKLMGNTFTDHFVPSANRSENKVRYVVKDEFEHTGERLFEYYVDSTAPVIDESKIGVPTNLQTESVSFRFTATATDAAAENERSSNVAMLQYTFDSEKAAANIVDVPGVSSLSENIIFSELFTVEGITYEGEKTIYIRAIDDVGNIGNWVSKKFMYDTAAPALNVSSYQRESESAISFTGNADNRSFETGKAFTLTGSVSDNNGLEVLEIWQKMEGESHTYTNSDSESEALGIKIFSQTSNFNGGWTISGLPRSETNKNNTAVESGTYIYTIRAVDKSKFGSQAAKVTTKTVTVKIDKTKPTVSINLAQNNTSDSTAYGENSIKGNAYTFRGTAKDDPENEGDFSSGFDTLYYAFTTTEVEPDWTKTAIQQPSVITIGTVNPSTDSWSVPMNLVTATQDNLGSDSDDTLCEGKKYLYVYGIDKSGNISDTAHVAFMVDQNSPVVTCAVYKDDSDATAETPVNGTVYLNEESAATSYTLRGTVWDANGISRLTIGDDDVDIADDGTWYKNFTTQGNNLHSIVVYDNSGNASINPKQTVISSSVIFDTTKPAVAVADFDATAATRAKWLSGTGDYYINGTASDQGAGLKEIKIKVDNAVWSSLPLTSNWSYKYTIPADLTENEDSDASYHTVSVKAVDNANNEKEETYYFRYDKTQPMAELAINKSGYIKESDFTDIVFSGYVHDGRDQGREVESAVIKVKKDNVIVDSLAMNVMTDAFGYVSTAGSTFGDFAKTGLSVADYEDGRYEFNLEVRDKAGNSPSALSTISAALVVDKAAPEITSHVFRISDTESVSAWNKNKSKAKIRVDFNDKNPEAVYYYVNDGSNTTLTQETVPSADWINMNYSGSNYQWTAEKDCSFNDGKGVVYIKVEDKAGNVTYATPLTYEVDTKKPDVCTLLTVDGAALSGSKLINGSHDVVFTVNATDYNDNYVNGTVVGNDATKVVSVKLTKIGDTTYTGDEIVDGIPTLSGGTTGTKTGTWTITIPTEKFQGKDSGSFPVTVTVKDNFENEKVFQMFTLDIDQNHPEIKNFSLESAYDIGVKDGLRTFYVNNTNTPFSLLKWLLLPIYHLKTTGQSV